jgi:PAS domain S-box-containing protein
MDNSSNQTMSGPVAGLHNPAGKLLNDISLWVQVIDSGGQVIFTNHFTEQLSGYSAKQFADGNLLWEELFSDKSEGLRLKNICLELLKDSRGFSNKMVEIVTQNGDMKRLLLTMDTLAHASGSHPNAILIGMVLPGESNLSEDVKANEQHYHSVFRNTSVGFFRSLAEGRFLEVSETLANMLGFDNAGDAVQLINNIGEEIYFNPDFRQTIVAEVSQSSQIKTYETVFKNRQGKAFHGRLNVNAHYDSAYSQWVLEGTLENITHRITADRELHEKANQAMLNISTAVSFTSKITELFEAIRTEISSLIDTRNFFIALYDETSKWLSLPYFIDEKDDFDHFPVEKTLSALVIETRESILLHRENILQLIDAGTINVAGTIPQVWLGAPLMVEGQVIGVMVVQNYQDTDAIREEHKQLLQVISPQISLFIERKQAEEKLRQSEQELREANNTKDRFFNIIAHDLKNPFNAIIGFSTLLCDEWNDFDDDDKITMITAIRQSSEGAYDLLMNLLDWSRVQLGTIDFNPAALDINSLIERNISLLKSNADKKNIRITFESCTHRQVFADANMLRTVIRNLLSNAIKFTYGFGIIHITTSSDPDYPNMLRFSIADSGVGIPPEKIQTLFALTKTRTTADTGGESGTGLGLILCKEFIDKNNGRIWVESTVGTGSTFHVAIPVQAAAKKHSNSDSKMIS